MSKHTSQQPTSAKIGDGAWALEPVPWCARAAMVCFFTTGLCSNAPGPSWIKADMPAGETKGFARLSCRLNPVMGRLRSHPSPEDWPVGLCCVLRLRLNQHKNRTSGSSALAAQKKEGASAKDFLCASLLGVTRVCLLKPPVVIFSSLRERRGVKCCKRMGSPLCRSSFRIISRAAAAGVT